MPLLEPLLHLLRQGGPHKLHELMSQLRTGGYLPQWPVAAQQQLFRTNFLLMNGLYQLQSRLLTEGAWLAVSPLALQILPLEAGEPALEEGLRLHGRTIGGSWPRIKSGATKEYDCRRSHPLLA